MLQIAVLSSELKWLPNGSEFILGTESQASNSSAKPKTYTSFSCSQDSLPEFSNDPIAPRDADIIIAKLGPGQVAYVLLCCFLLKKEKTKEENY